MEKFTENIIKYSNGKLSEKICKWTLVGMIIVMVLSCFALFFHVLGCYPARLIISDYGDFFNVLDFVQNGDPYIDAKAGGGFANYPPLGYLILYPFALLARISGPISSTTVSGIISMILFLLLTYVPAILLTYKALPFDKGGKLLGTAAIFLCYIAFFEFERLNINILVLEFCLLFYCFYDSENKFLKGVSVFSLAAAGAIKLYPLFLALIFIKDKRYKDFILCGIYFVLLVFLPLFFFKDGIKNFGYMIEAITSFVNDDKTHFNMNDMAVHKLLRGIWAMIGLTYTNTVGLAFSVLKYGLFILSTFALIFTQNRFKFLLLATLAYLNFTDNNYTYSLIFLLIPFLAFFNDKETFSLDKDTLVTPESTFYLLSAGIMLSFFYDLILVIPLFAVFTL
ncbi:MAG: DUF2029 domain-containing protein, partial [Clostridia bacterium]|nr:DUF2029 domain-containing protein [Clostridia bacterium]